jgi:hypothetical protein
LSLDHRRRACLHHLEVGTPVRRRIDVMAQPHKKGFDEICKKNMGLSNDFHKFTVFENHPKKSIWILKRTMLGDFDEFLSSQNVVVARFARNVE